jgi:transcription elongation factor GreA
VQVFSAKAPLGAAVIGHKAGDTLTYQAPNGREIEVAILGCKPFTG